MNRRIRSASASARIRPRVRSSPAPDQRVVAGVGGVGVFPGQEGVQAVLRDPGSSAGPETRADAAWGRRWTPGGRVRTPRPAPGPATPRPRGPPPATAGRPRPHCFSAPAGRGGPRQLGQPIPKPPERAGRPTCRPRAPVSCGFRGPLAQGIRSETLTGPPCRPRGSTASCSPSAKRSRWLPPSGWRYTSSLRGPVPGTQLRRPGAAKPLVVLPARPAGVEAVAQVDPHGLAAQGLVETLPAG